MANAIRRKKDLSLATISRVRTVSSQGHDQQTSRGKRPLDSEAEDNPWKKLKKARVSIVPDAIPSSEGGAVASIARITKTVNNGRFHAPTNVFSPSRHDATPQRTPQSPTSQLQKQRPITSPASTNTPAPKSAAPTTIHVNVKSIAPQTLPTIQKLPTPAKPGLSLTKHRERVLNGIRHELDRLQPSEADRNFRDGGGRRKLRSQDNSRLKSDLSYYFPEYDQVIGNDPKEESERPPISKKN